MQSINVVTINRWFLTVFFGTGAAGIIVIVAALERCGQRLRRLCG